MKPRNPLPDVKVECDHPSCQDRATASNLLANLINTSPDIVSGVWAFALSLTLANLIAHNMQEDADTPCPFNPANLELVATIHRAALSNVNKALEHLCDDRYEFNAQPIIMADVAGIATTQPKH